MAVSKVEVAFSTNGASTPSATIATTPAAGDYVIVVYSCTAANTISSVTGMGATWGTPVGISAAGVTHWFCLGTGATTSGTVTATTTATKNGGMAVFLVRGVPSGATLSTPDTVTVASGTAITGPTTSAGVDSFVLGVMGVDSNTLTWPDTQTPSGAWTAETLQAGSFHAYRAGSAIPTSTTNYSTTGVGGNFVNKRISQVVLAASGGTTTPVSLTGELSTLTLAAPAGTISIPTPVSLTGEVSTVTLAAAAGTVDAGSPVALTGDFTVMVLGTYNGTVTITPAAGAVSLTGELSTLTLAAPAGLAVTAGITATIDFGAGAGLAMGAEPFTYVDASVTFGAGAGLEFGAGSSTFVDARMDFGAGAGLRVLMPRDWGNDPRTGRPEYYVVIADRFGNRYTELGEATISPLATGVNVLDSWSFRIARSDPRAAQVQPVAREAQLWRGNVCMSKGPIGPGRPEGEFITFDVSDRRWYMWGGRRVIGRIPRLNLLYNGDFTEGLAGWTPTYDAGSAPEAPPLVEIIDDPYTDGGKALQITGQDKVQMTKNVVETSAVFVPNSASYLPGGEAAIQAVGTSITDGSTVHVVGHTANDGTGSGLTLSLNRAKAARATLLAQDPTLSFTLLPGLRSPNANDGSVAGRGYYEPISSSLAPNRRVEIFYDTLQTATGHRQYVRQYVTVSQPVEERMPLEVVFSGDMRIIEWIGAPKDGWAVKLILTKVGAPTVEVDEGNAQMEQADLLDEWASYSASVTVPADGLDYRIEVRLYPPAGTSVWTNCRLEPQEQLGFFGVDQALIVKALIEHAQDTSYGHGALGIGTRTPLTGVSRRKKYPMSEHMPIETAVEWFTSIAKGLDIDYDHEANAVVTYYPKQGSTSDMALVHGGRASIVKAYKPLTSGVRDIASSVIVQGGGFTGSRPERYASDPAALGGTLLEAVITAEEETPLNELDEAATSALASMLRARPGWEVTLDPARTSDVLDRLHKGDTCRLVLPDEGVDGLYRMVVANLDPETDILTLTLIEEG